MENSRLKLPAGIQTFEQIRKENYVYVDKTRYLVKLIDTGKVFFLARPRRFGKSLTISTFDALFSGNKELFQRLYAEEFLNRPDFKPSPVIRINMSDITTSQGLDKLEESLKQLTIEIAHRLDVEVPTHLCSGDTFRSLIVNTFKKYSSKVVVLIDEYDKPFTDFIDQPEMAKSVRLLLRDYYTRIKANDEYIRFIFITGISKFTKMGIFSTLNNLVDISLNEEYGNICGYTEAEIIKYFPEYLDDTAQKNGISKDELIEKMKNYYDGFCFDIGGKTHLYNPFSTLNFFQIKRFLNFWFESATPSMLAKYLKTQKLTVEQFRHFPVSEDFVYNSVEIENALPENYLFQTGYLSLRPGITDDFSLDYPNTEVLNSMSALVAQNILQEKDEDFSRCRSRVLIALSTKNYDLLKDALNSLLASIPYDDFTKAGEQSVLINGYKFPVQEWLYRSTILAFMRGCGIVVSAEMHTNLGRADLVIAHKGNIWVIEMKVAYKGNSTATKAKEALQQIMDNNYAKPYPNAFCIGLAIDDSLRQITDLEYF